MNKVVNLSKMFGASFICKKTLSQVIGGNDNAISANISRWINNGKLIQLKKGMYVTREYWQQLGDKQSYGEFMANTLKKSSYLSGEYVLQKYGILSESVFSFTSITRKKTRTYSNKLGMFMYSNIKDSLFTGFEIVNKNGFEIKIATKVKALFDYLYIRLWKVSNINQEVVDSLRLNLGELTMTDFDKLEYFINLSEVKKFNNLIIYLKEAGK